MRRRELITFRRSIVTSPGRCGRRDEPSGPRRRGPVKINGIAHIVLTVNRPELALPFYERLFGFLELKTVFRHERGAYFIGGKTAVAIVPAETPHDQAAFAQTRIGLHHLCFRAYAREDVDRLHAHLCEMGAKIVHPPEAGPWAPGYYSVLFEDPDGIRLEMNHVPGKGNLDPSISLPRQAP